MEWLKLKKPLGPKSQRCVGFTASKCGMRLSTRQRLRPSRHLKRVENVYCPRTILTSGPSSSQDDTTPNVANPTKEALSKDPPPPSNSQKGEEQAKEPKAPIEMTKPSDAPKDTSKDGVASQSLELVLATLPIPEKEDPKSKKVAPSIAATT